MNRGSGGYTIIELAVVIVVVSILAGITLVEIGRASCRERVCLYV